MELHIRFLGLDLLALSLTTEQTAYEAACDDEPGDCTTMPLGFVARNEIPDEAGPYREGWE